MVFVFFLLEKVYKGANSHLLGPGWFKRSGCGSLWMQVVAVSSGFKRFVRMVLRLEIGAFAGYL